MKSKLYRQTWGPILFGLGTGVVLIGLFLGGIHYYSTLYPALLPSTGIAFAVGTLLVLVGAGLSLGTRMPRFSRGLFAGCCVGLGLFVVSDAPYRPWNAFQVGAPVLASIGATVVAWAGLRYARSYFLPFVTAATVAFLYYSFINASGGRLIFSDDHPAFWLRLEQLRRHFPNVPFYSPLWNAGYDARDAYPSGALAVFFLFAPVVYLFDLRHSYNHIVSILLFLVVPGSMVLSARALRWPWAVAWIASLLSLYTSLYWYRWSLSYGTLGFILSVSMLPLVFACFSRASRESASFRWPYAVLLFASLVLCVLWPLGSIMLLPLAALSLISVRQLLRRRAFVLAVCAAACIMALWAPIFAASSRVTEFLKVDTPKTSDATAPAAEAADDEAKPVPARPDARVKGGHSQFSLSEVFARVRRHGNITNPLVWFFALPGFLALRRRERLWFGVLGGWLLFLGAIAPDLKPQLELDRMLVALAILWALPVSKALWKWGAGPVRNSGALLPRALVSSTLAALPIGVLMLVPVQVGNIVTNRTVQRFSFANSDVDGLVHLIQDQGGEGRTLFTGFILHELSEGHIAPLPYWTGKRLVASSPQHSRWQYTDVIPRHLLKQGEAGILRFLSLYNVSAVVAHDKRWKKWLADRPNLFEERGTQGRFKIFKVKGFSPNYFIEGKGQVVDDSEPQVRLRLDTPDAVVAYSFMPFLKASRCKLERFEVEPEIEFVKLSGCPTGEEIVVESVPPVARIKDLF